MINGLISIGIFLVIQLVAAVWWAASVSTKLGFVIEAGRGTKSTFDAHVAHDLATFSTKSEVTQALLTHEKEVAVALSFAQKEMQAVWKQLDKLNGKV